MNFSPIIYYRRVDDTIREKKTTTTTEKREWKKINDSLNVDKRILSTSHF